MSVHLFPLYRERYLPALTLPEIRRAARRPGAVVVLPTGAVEQHGPHLPVGVDALLGQVWCAHAARYLPRTAPVWFLPPVTVGKSNEHAEFPGTIEIGAITLGRIVRAVAAEVAGWGFRRLAFLNTHGGNSAVLIALARDLSASTALEVVSIGGTGYAPKISAQEALYGFHANEVETALVLAAAPTTVRMERAVREYPARVEDSGELRPENAPATFSWVTSDISRSGIMGDAPAATPEKGREWLEGAARQMAVNLAALAQPARSRGRRR